FRSGFNRPIKIGLFRGEKALGGPVFGRSFRPIPRGVVGDLIGDLANPDGFVIAEFLNNARIPNPVQVTTVVKPANLELVSAPIVSMTDVERLMHVLNEMDEELEGLLLLLLGGIGIFQRRLHSRNGRNHAAGGFGTELWVVLGFTDVDVYI